MNKKRITGLILIAVSLVAVIIVVVKQFYHKPVQPEDLLASGAIGYWRAVNLREAMEGFSQTQFMQSLKAIDLEAAARQIGATEEQLAMSRLLWAQVSNQANRRFVAELFGNDLAVAVYPVQARQGASTIQKMTDALSQISIVTRLSPGVKFIELLTAAASRVSLSISEITQEYRGKTIHVIDIQGLFFDLAYVRVKDFLIIGLGETAAKRTIDVMAGHGPSLAEDSTCQDVQAGKIVTADQSGYFNYGAFIQQMEAVLMIPENPQDQTPAQRRMAEGFKNARGFELFSCSLTYGSVMQGRCDFSFKGDRVSDDVRRFYNFTARENATLAFVPKPAALYSWNAMIRLDFYWEMFQRQLSEARRDGSQTRQSGLMTMLSTGNIQGVEVQKLVDLLADESGFYFTEIKIGRIPVPQGVVFFKVKDVAEVRELLQQIFPEQGMLAFQREIYQDADIAFLSPFPFLADLEPAYCFVQDYLLLSPHREALKQALDAARDPRDLWRGTVSVSQESDVLIRPSNGLVFVRLAHWAQEGKKILAWANEWAGIQDQRRKAFEAGAQKRLDDVNENLSRKEDELAQLEAQLIEEQHRQQDAGTVVPQELDEMLAQWEQKSALLSTTREAVENLLKEKNQLETAHAQSEPEGGLRLTAAGERRLAELAVQLPKRRERLAELETAVKQLDEQRNRLQRRRAEEESLSALIAEKESRFAEIRREMKALEESREELENVLAAYSRSNLPTEEQRGIALRSVLNPFLDSLEFVPWAAVTTMMLPDRIRSEFFWEVR